MPALVCRLRTGRLQLIVSWSSRAVGLCVIPDPTFAADIQEALAGSTSDAAKTAYAAAAGNIPIGSVTDGGSSGGVSGGASGGSTGPIGGSNGGFTAAYRSEYRYELFHLQCFGNERSEFNRRKHHQSLSLRNRAHLLCWTLWAE